MGWSGFDGGGREMRFQELEQFTARTFHVSRVEPDDELPDAEPPVENQRVALGREAARRMIVERT